MLYCCDVLHAFEWFIILSLHVHALDSDAWDGDLIDGKSNGEYRVRFGNGLTAGEDDIPA